MKKRIVIAPVNNESEEKVLLASLKDFPTERVILLTSPEGIVKAEGFVGMLDVLGIPGTIVRVQPTKNPWEDYFVAFAEVLEGLEKDRVLVNIATADRISQCALTNAAHVNGIRAIAVINGEIVMLPILKLSFTSILSPKKIRMLRELQKSSCFASIEDLSKSTGMSLQLASYHIHGNEKSDGLVQLELVDIDEGRGKTRVCLSTMGRLFMKGYLG
ncbi:MAG: hypothetical protein ABII71_03055 [Candidatus Micrarchaeota archaeon]